MKKLFRFVFQLVALTGTVILGFMLARELKRNKPKYQRQLEHAATNIGHRLEEGREYTEELAEEGVGKAKEVIEQILPGEQFPEKKGVKDLHLSSRQNVVFAIIKGKKSIEMRDLLPRIPGVTERTLRRDLVKLQELGLIEKHGSTKSSTYVLKH